MKTISSLEKIREWNKNLVINEIDKNTFREYGKVLTEYEFDSLIKYADENIQIPAEGNNYFASVSEIEDFEVINCIKDKIYGQMEIEAGSCAGQNTALTGVEYHQGSEVVIAVTDCLLLLGKRQDIENNTYNSSKVEAFYIKKGQAVELYATTLHYTPCKVDIDGYMTIVVLLKGTNDAIVSIEGSILTKKNKWFVTHKSQAEKVKSGVYPGLLGELIEVVFSE